MADDQNINAVKHRTHEQLRRAARDKFNQRATQEALNEAIYSVPGITVFDARRVMEQLERHLNDFLGIDHFKEFRKVTTAWVTRQAQLVIVLRELLQTTNDYNPTRLFNELPNYSGAVSVTALNEWAYRIKLTDAHAKAEIPAWVDQYRKVVYSGIWYVLKDCMDLGVGGYAPVVRHEDGQESRLFHPVVEEIASDVWLWVYKEAFLLVNSAVPLHIRLWHKARRTALIWKLNRLADRRTFVSQSTLDDRRQQLESLHDLDERELDALELSAEERRLLTRLENVDIEDTCAFDRALCDDPETRHEGIASEMENELPLAA